jgi:tetratricopeptide (TPR) repeat protein
MSRRYLFGPVSDARAAEERPWRPEGDRLVFGPGRSADVVIGPEDPWPAIGSRWPPDWHPEFLLLDLCGGASPEGLWESPAPIVGLAADRVLGWQEGKGRWSRCDRLLSGPAVTRLRSSGFAEGWDDILGWIDREWPSIAARALERRRGDQEPALARPQPGELAEIRSALEGCVAAPTVPPDPGLTPPEAARRALALLDGSDPMVWPGRQAGPADAGLDFFRAEWARAAQLQAGQTEADDQARHALLRWRAHALLARATGDLVHHYEAVLARPDLPVTRAALGMALAQAGRPAEAIGHLEQALALDPMDLDTARALFQALEAVGAAESRRRLARQRRLLHEAAPELVPLEPWFAAAPRPSDQPGAISSAPEVLPAPAGSTRPLVSLCMIVRDEEANLPDCLASAADLVGEVIVVDTGSTDGTRAVAGRFGARVFEFPWVDDFAAARNESLRHATGEWIFWLDADDRLDEDNRRKLLALFAGLEPDENVAYAMKCLCPNDPAESSATVVDHIRVFRNDPRIRWRYRVHEQILPAVRRLKGQVRWSDVTIRHVGYQDPALRRSKLERDLRLLRTEVAEQPDDPFVLFNLGSVYLELERTAEALPLLQRSLRQSHPSDSIVRKLHALIVQGHRRLGQVAEALAACRAGRAVYPDDMELLFQEGLVLRELGDRPGAESCLLRLLQAREDDHFASVDPALRGYKARHNLAVLYQEQGRLGEAETQWRAVTEERPEFTPAWRALGELYLAQGRWPELERVAQRLDSAAAEVEAIVLRGRAALARKEFATARRLVESAIARAPQALRPRVVLSHVLLQEGREPQTAERALRDILALDPLNAEARHNLSVLLARP